MSKSLMYWFIGGSHRWRYDWKCRRDRHASFEHLRASNPKIIIHLVVEDYQSFMKSKTISEGTDDIAVLANEPNYWQKHKYKAPPDTKSPACLVVKRLFLIHSSHCHRTFRIGSTRDFLIVSISVNVIICSLFLDFFLDYWVQVHAMKINLTS